MPNARHLKAFHASKKNYPCKTKWRQLSESGEGKLVAIFPPAITLTNFLLEFWESKNVSRQEEASVNM